MKAGKSRVPANIAQKSDRNRRLVGRQLFDALAVPIIVWVSTQVEKTKLRHKVVRIERFERPQQKRGKIITVSKGSEQRKVVEVLVDDGRLGRPPLNTRKVRRDLGAFVARVRGNLILRRGIGHRESRENRLTQLFKLFGSRLHESEGAASVAGGATKK